MKWICKQEYILEGTSIKIVSSEIKDRWLVVDNSKNIINHNNLLPLKSAKIKAEEYYRENYGDIFKLNTLRYDALKQLEGRKIFDEKCIVEKIKNFLNESVDFFILKEYFIVTDIYANLCSDGSIELSFSFGDDDQLFFDFDHNCVDVATDKEGITTIKLEDFFNKDKEEIFSYGIKKQNELSFLFKDPILLDKSNLEEKIEEKDKKIEELESKLRKQYLDEISNMGQLLEQIECLKERIYNLELGREMDKKEIQDAIECCGDE